MLLNLVSNKQKLIFWTLILTIFLAGIGFTLLPWTAQATGPVIINEIVASNGTTLTDEDGEATDWIELFNPNPYPINLAAFALSDEPDQPQKWLLPDLSLPAGHYLLIFASGKNRSAPPHLHTNFKLNKSGDFLGLYSILDQQFVDTIQPAPQFRDIAYGRFGDGTGVGYLEPPTPGGPNDSSQIWTDVVQPVQVSVERGFYESPFELALSSDTPEAVIRYTLDGSEPTKSNGTKYRAPLKVSSTTLLRTAAFKPGYLPATIETHSYIFLDDVLTQPPEPPAFPPAWGVHREEFKHFKPGDPVVADYEMDPEVVNDPRYRDSLDDSLKSLPILSIGMNIQDFTDLYSHPRDRGRKWERPASVEYIDSGDQAEGFQIDAGLRIHGGVGRKEFIPKHSFRLIFRGEYGATKLRYPLFPDSPVETFNTLVLRGGSDRSFAGLGPIRENTTYTRDEWMRASQLAMSDLGAHGIFVHLYINGLYWGLYNVVERPDESFMAAYFGGREDEWFVANQDGPLSRESTEWRDRLNRLFISIAFEGRADDTLERPDDYIAQQIARVKPYLDTAQFSDYIILNWYAGTEDWPQNNWYAGIPYPEGDGKYLVWDGQEIFYDGAKITLGKVSKARLNVVKPLFEILIQAPDFKMEFADRMVKHLSGDGALTDANAQTRWLQINRTIEQAIIAESARWGDVWLDQPITQADWFRARNDVLKQMEGNAAKLIRLAREAGYYPSLDPPLFSHSGGMVEPDLVLTMSQAKTNLATENIIYYTTTGIDPRMAGTGKVSPEANVYQKPLTLTGTTHLKARVFNGQEWSALNEATFSVVAHDPKLRITEIMYNPRGGNEYEFIELKNIGESAIDLSGMWFEGIDFTFPASTPPLEAGAILVLVHDPAAFEQRYPGVSIDGVYNRRLSNAGEQLILNHPADKPIISVRYDDEHGWPISPDGRGDSLVLVDLNGDPNSPKSWRASANLHGSPRANDPQQEIVDQFLP